MIWRVTKLVAVGVLVRKAARNPAVATPARALFGRFAKRREAGRWHDVEPPAEPPVEPPEK
ncbi:MAG: hypothetical protein M3Q31_15640 [Actinomycetota bacterium]|nr:hypothetical protein [Actinomycetota bacterium]